MSETAPTSPDWTEDDFLSGQIRLRQPKDGYRAGIDAVLMAGSLGLKPEQRALELGCGAGGGLLCAAQFFPACEFVGVERNDQAFARVQDNIALNQLNDRVSAQHGDIKDVSLSGFDHVFFNPPFFEDAKALRAPKETKKESWIASEPIKVWIDIALQALRGRGHITIIHRAVHLGDILQGLGKQAGEVTILPLHPRQGEPAKRVIVRARKHAKTPLKLLSPIFVHDEAGEYDPRIKSVLRGEAPLAISD